MDQQRTNSLADQRLVDAMLRGLRLDTSEAMAGRLAQVQEAIQEDQATARPRPVGVVGSTRRRSWLTFTRAALGGVSALAAVLLIAVFMQPSPVSATALLERAHALELKSTTGDRRYQVSVLAPHGRGELPTITGVLDVRDGDQMRFDLTQPNGKHHVWGIGPEGPWQLPPNGKPVREAKGRWPRWLQGTSQALLIDTMPSLLDLVIGGYDATTSRENEQTVIIATQRDASEGGPDEIVIQLDHEGGAVSTLELRWKPDSDERWRKAREHARVHGVPGTPPRRDDRTTDGQRRPPAQGARGGRRDGAEDRGPDREFARDHDRRRMANLRHRRPGGPPAPRSIRFERVPSATVPHDWYLAPEDVDPASPSA